MNQNPEVRIFGAAQSTHFKPVGKCSRDSLICLRVESFIDERVVDQVLSIICDKEVYAVDVAMQRDARLIVLSVTFSRFDILPTARLLCRIEALRSVRSADFVDLLGDSIEGNWNSRK